MKSKLVIAVAVIFAALAFAGCSKGLLDPAAPGNLVPKTVDQDASLPAIFVNNTLLHAETFGNPDSAMIVVLHGGPGSDYRYMRNCKAFADNGYFVVCYDQRGAGLSQRFNKDIYSVQIMLDDLDSVIHHYRKSPTQKVFLLGHSWGGMLATAYINAYPTRINGAILAEPGGFTLKDTKDYLSRSNKVDLFSEATNDVLYYDQFFTGKQDQHEILDYKMGLRMAFETAPGNTIGDAGPYPFWRFGAITAKSLLNLVNKTGFNWTTNLHSYTTKVLFLYSELNKAYGIDHAKLVSSAYPNVQLEEVYGCGHDLTYFGWDNFYPLALTYLNKLKY
ncbi:alpha/beta hydrolase [Chitinophagaceae bacterium LWZ2-11]